MSNQSEIKTASEMLAKHKNAFFIGRGADYCLVSEAALKLIPLIVFKSSPVIFLANSLIITSMLLECSSIDSYKEVLETYPLGPT